MTTMRQTNSMHRYRRSAFVAACCIAVVGCSLWWQANLAQAQESLSVTATFDAGRPVTPETSIELRLSRALKEGEGRIAVLINRTDLTSLFIIDGTRLVYSPALVPLPSGRSEVVVYLVGADGAWSEVARLDLDVVKEVPLPSQAPAETSQTTTSSVSEVDTRASVNGDATARDAATKAGDATTPATPDIAPVVQEVPPSRRRFGFDKMDLVPSLTLSSNSQPAQFNFPAETRPSERATFIDGTMQFSLRSEMARGRFGAQTQFDFAGSTFQADALRFGTLGDRAPQIDLSSYLAQFQLGRVKVMIGHTSFGSARHLINSFSSRGIIVTVPITKRFDFSLAVMNGTNVVGYGNFFGVGKSKHQLQSITIGVELLTERPGGLRLEFSGINAYIQALNSFSQGSVNDVERSRGGSVRLIASDKAGRFRFDGGFTRSQYRNPADPLLYQGTNTLAVPFLTRNARYVDVSFDLLRGFSLTKSKQVNLSLAVRHEQVDPLYKSLGAPAGADKRQNEFQISGNIGEISFQVGHGRFNDNLRRIVSILRSLTRSMQYSFALPAAALWGGNSNSSKFLPQLSYSRSETHQFGAAIPVNGGFETDASAIPDQFSTNQSFSADWQFQKLNLSSSYNRSFTNNQQPGRERSDFLNQTMGVRVGFTPTSRLNLNLDLTRDSATDLENTEFSRTWRLGSTVSWNMNSYITLTAGLSNTIAGDRALTNGSRNTEFDTQFSYRYGIERGGLKKVQAQLFIRYADRYARSHDLIFQTSNLTRVKIFNAGLNITLF